MNSSCPLRRLVSSARARASFWLSAEGGEQYAAGYLSGIFPDRISGLCRDYVGILSDRMSVLRRDYVGIASGLCRGLCRTIRGLCRVPGQAKVA